MVTMSRKQAHSLSRYIGLASLFGNAPTSHQRPAVSCACLSVCLSVVSHSRRLVSTAIADESGNGWSGLLPAGSNVPCHDTPRSKGARSDALLCIQSLDPFQLNIAVQSQRIAISVGSQRCSNSSCSSSSRDGRFSVRLRRPFLRWLLLMLLCTHNLSHTVPDSGPARHEEDDGVPEPLQREDRRGSHMEFVGRLSREPAVDAVQTARRPCDENGHGKQEACPEIGPLDGVVHDEFRRQCPSGPCYGTAERFYPRAYGITHSASASATAAAAAAAGS